MRAKTIEQDMLHGSAPRIKSAVAQSPFTGGRPAIPNHLSQAAKRTFQRCMALLSERRTLTPGDVATLEVYAELHARWVAAKRSIGNNLTVATEVTDNHGEVRVVQKLNPLLKVVETCESRLLALAKALGLTPTTRDHVKQTKPDEDEQLPPNSYGAWKQQQEIENRQAQPILVPEEPEEQDEDGNDEEQSAN